MNNDTEQISRYLLNEMAVEEKAAFEKQLTADKDLQQELSIQQQIIKAAETAGLKTEFSNAIKKKIFIRRLLQWGAATAILTTAFVFYALKTNLFSSHTENRKANSEKAESFFIINNAADTIIETKDGVVFAIPANAFGNSRNNIRIEIKTALTAYDIMSQGLSTESNGALLQTAGMFYINGYDGDKPVSLVKNIAVSVPAAEVNPNMQLFDGVEDTNGIINWVNPKAIEKGLRTYDITTLDFYPQDYIPTLQALQKEYKNKRYTDSLYYSFSGFYGNTVNPKPANEDGVAITNTRDTGYKRDDENIVYPDSSRKVDTIGWDYSSETDAMYYEVDPAKIKAIWNKKFNNTILATKEFEERLKFIHTLCDKKYLDAYVQGLGKPMSEIDQLCAGISNGDVKKKFLEFAARKDGGVILKEGMQEKLSDYFQQKYKAYQQAAEKTWAKHEAELTKLDAIADTKKRGQAKRDYIRDSLNLEEEFCINLTDAYQQIGVKLTCNDTIIPPSSKYYNVTISSTGWKNLDLYVFDATTTKESMNYTDPVTGKTAALVYKGATINIEGFESFDKVFIYLIPDNLSSFQRVMQQGGIFKESLNMLFKYDAVAIAYKGTETFFYKQNNLQPGQHTFKLLSATDGELRAAVKNYSKQKSADIKAELEYQYFNQQEILRQIKLEDELAFLGKVAVAIFKCSRFEVKEEARAK